ncbi:MAG TPA: methyltransferase domain-containing protein [Kofleriaceae bacterium]|nr:methyltransferase domain-containing protein [Kofleriaceae bacterium]
MEQRRETDMLDADFDALVPAELRHLSNLHWTPISVAIRAAKLLAPDAGARVLDIGAGIGKLCTIGALCTRANWVGIECQPALVTAAERIARTFGVADRTTFVLGDAFSLAWTEFDALYFFNPFELPLFPTTASSTFRIAIAETERRLGELRPGTRVVTLHGFGGTMPACYELLWHELELACWIRRS